MPSAVIGGALGAVGSIVGSSKSSKAATKAAETQAAAADRSAEVQLQMFRETQQALAPWRQQGVAALNQYSQMLGLPVQQPAAQVAAQPVAQPATGGYLSTTNLTPRIFQPGYLGAGRLFREDLGRFPQFNMQQPQAPQQTTAPPEQPQATEQEEQPAPDYSAFFKTPGYQFELDEATKASERAASARGMRLSGGQLAELQRIAQGQASRGYLNYMNQLAGLAGLGQSAGQSLGALGQSAASGAGAAYQAGGAATAGGYLGSAQAFNQGLSGVGQGIGVGLGYLSSMPQTPQAMPAVGSFPQVSGLTGTMGAQGVYGGMPLPGGI